MIVSRKRFDQEVKRRANAICRAEVQEALIEKYGAEISRLNKRIRRLEKQIQKGPDKGSIHGFYEKPAETTIIRKEATDETK